MYESLGTVTLKGGETVDAGVVIGPDPEWADRVADLLSHKGEVWRWQNGECLRSDLGIDARFYLLQRDGEPFANMLTATHRGVGHFGHVYTVPEERRKGAASALMRRLMQDVRRRGERALFLGTGFDSPPYHIYAGEGFVGLEPGCGLMDWYVDSRARFEEEWFAAGPVEVRPASWSDWPATAPLFTLNVPGTVRCAPLRMFGRSNSEGPWLHLLHDDACQGSVLQQRETGAVVGAAVAGAHPLWPATGLLDLWCHPGFWSGAEDLLAGLDLRGPDRWLALSDDGCPAKGQVLAAAGFAPVSTAPDRLAVDTEKTRWSQITEWERAGS